ncbi:hypothetical protein [Microbacterium sp. 179-I 3D4 NHS]|uniref:hypothetical protein n=1 Tax=Microbacterium sp. 179-I 3D4 NHS TaxID=3142381 RepID=UPI0039A2C28E
MTDGDLLGQARDVNFTFKAALAEVQMQVLDGEWKVTYYGGSPKMCGDSGYSFAFQRATLPHWKLNEPTGDAADRIAAWLDENGWENITTQGYSGDIADIVIQAEKPDAYVDRLMIDISPDPDTYDIATITAETACFTTDVDRLDALLEPGAAEDSEDLERVPSTEHPTAKPSFGYTPDGKRRFWDTDGE